MRILILHQNRYYKVKYDAAIDHGAHDVHYAGTAEYLAQIPQGLRCHTCLLDAETPIKEQLRAWVQEHGPFDRVLTRQENLLMTAAELRAEFEIPGMRPDEMILFRDKVQMKDAILRAGIRAPRYCKVERDLCALPWSGKTILKPRDGAGSQGIKLFATTREAIAHIQETAASQPDHAYFSSYELEEFLEGPIWHVDGYLFDGKPVAMQTSKYIGTCLDYSFGSSIGSIQFDHPALAAWALDCMRALNARNLTFHLEAIMTDEGPAFMEVAGRAGGGDIVETFERATGIHLHVLDMASDVDGKVAERHARATHSGKKYGFFIIAGHQLKGAPCRVLGADELLQAPIVEDYRILPEDAPTPKKPTYQAHDVPLSGIVCSPDPGQLESWMRQLFASVRVVPAPVASAETPARDTDGSCAEWQVMQPA
jgi:ATP-grasp domain